MFVGNETMVPTTKDDIDGTNDAAVKKGKSIKIGTRTSHSNMGVVVGAVG